MTASDLFTPDLFNGQRVRLTAPHPDDKPIIAAWSQITEYGRLMFYGSPAEPITAEGVRMPGPDDQLNWKMFAIRTVTENKLIGFTSLFSINWASQAGTFAIGIGDSAYWGQGYGTEATQLMLGYCFRELGLHRIGLIVFAYNERARHVYEKLGFVYEGEWREAMYKDGKRYNVITMGILRREWEATQAKLGKE